VGIVSHRFGYDELAFADLGALVDQVRVRACHLRRYGINSDKPNKDVAWRAIWLISATRPLSHSLNDQRNALAHADAHRCTGNSGGISFFQVNRRHDRGESPTDGLSG
jgi:hypothetical protein